MPNPSPVSSPAGGATDTLTREMIAAMWIFGEQYATQRLGIREWWPTLTESRKACVRRFLADLDAASPTPNGEAER